MKLFVLKKKATWILGFLFIIFLMINSGNLIAQDYSQKVDDLNREIKELAKEKKLKQKEKKKIESLLKKKEKEIGGIESRIEKVSKQVDSKKRRVTKLESLIKKDSSLAAQTESQKQAMVVAAHKLSQINYVKLLLNQKNPNVVTRNGDYFDYLLKYKSDHLRQLEQSITGFHRDQEKLTNAINELKGVETNYLGERKKLKKANVERQRLLAKLGKDINKTSKKIKKLSADRARLRTLLAKLNKQKKTLPKYSPKQGSFAKQRSRLPYPVVGSIKNSFGKRISGSRLKSNGVTLKTKANTPVRAVYDGQVIFAKALKGFGNLIIVDHGDSYMSLYAHNAVLNRRVGDIVDAGDTLAKTSGANKFYFELRHKGKPMDPARWCKL